MIEVFEVSLNFKICPVTLRNKHKQFRNAKSIP